jgi:spermidine synthase
LPLALALFALSGAGALVIETTWMRWLRELLGATAPAASATLAAFFLGQALGAAAAARLARRAARPLAAFGALQLAASAWALAVPALLGVGEAALGAAYDELRGSPALLALARFACALAATLPASIALGALLPTLAEAAVGGAAALGRRGGALYGANTLGAAAGTALASFWLPDLLGVRAGYAFGVALLAASGAAALAASLGGDRATPRRRPGREDERSGAARVGREERRAEATASPREGVSPTRAPGAAPLLALAAFSGFGSFAAEVLLVQALGLALDQSVYAFGAVLGVVLVALGAGAFAVATAERAGVAPQALLALGLAGAGIGLAAFPALFFAASGGLAPLASARPWPGYLVAALALTLATAGPPVLLAGLVFPSALAAEGLRAGSARASAPSGRLLAVNTLGALAGALAAPWLLLPRLGLFPSFAALGAAYAAAALGVPAASRRARAATAGAIAAGGAGLALAANPLAVPALRLEPGERVVSLEASTAGLVAVVARGDDLLIRTDSHYALGGVSQAVHEERQAHLPLLLHPRAKRVAWLGAATGISAGAALAHPVERLALIEIVPGVARAAARFFGAHNRGVYADPRVDVVLDDGRNFLRSTRERFDAIVADLFVPWQAGAGALYTREQFAAARERLAQDGLFCQWLPLYQLGEEEFRVVLATFLDVFPRAALFRGDFYGRFPIAALVGYAGAAPAADLVSAAAERLAAAGVRDRWVTHTVGVWSLYVGPLAPLSASLAAVPRNTDDRPRVEFLAARSHAGAGAAERMFTGVRLAAFARSVAEGLRADDPLFGPLGEARLRAAAGGHALQTADALYHAGRREESSRALAAASERLPRELLAEAPPDFTAAGVWPAEAPAPPGG